MKPPALPIEHPDRMLILAQEMQAEVHSVMEAARLAGYEVYEIDSIVRFLCQEFAMKHRREVSARIEADMRRRGY